MTEVSISLRDGYFDLRGLAAYSTLGVSTLRDYIRRGKLPAFKVRGKVLVRKSEFDLWIQDYRMNKKKDIDRIADDALRSMKRPKSEQ